MIPLRDHNPSGQTPWVTYILIGLNTLSFLFLFLMPADLLEDYIYSLALIPKNITQGTNLFTLLTSIFLHAGWGHLLGNMLFLHIFGDNLEDYLGHFKYLVFYILCGLGAGLAQVLIDPSSDLPVLGASGAIAGVLGGYLVLFPRHQIDVLFSFGWYLRTIRLPAYSMLFYWFLAQLLYGVGSLGMMGGGVAYFAHIGGFICGGALLQIQKRLRLRSPPRATIDV